jgi:hypothetical protein
MKQRLEHDFKPFCWVHCYFLQRRGSILYGTEDSTKFVGGGWKTWQSAFNMATNTTASTSGFQHVLCHSIEPLGERMQIALLQAVIYKAQSSHQMKSFASPREKHQDAQFDSFQPTLRLRKPTNRLGTRGT